MATKDESRSRKPLTKLLKEEIEVSEEIQEKAGSETPTSSDVGKQTLTKADLGYDVTVEGVHRR